MTYPLLSNVGNFCAHQGDQQIKNDDVGEQQVEAKQEHGQISRHSLSNAGAAKLPYGAGIEQSPEQIIDRVIELMELK